MELIDQYGQQLMDFISTSYKYKIIIKSKPYNIRGAYYAYESTYITIGDSLYITLTADSTSKLIDSYVEYYNNYKHDSVKEHFNMPTSITQADIKSMTLHALPSDYVDYYNR